jgi:outer membrane protein assembly factor BamB
VLVAVVSAAAVGRLRAPSPQESSSATATVTSSLPALSGPTSGLDAPLRTPRPPAEGGVERRPTRMVHGGPRHEHRSGAHGPHAPKVGWRVAVPGAVAAQVTTSPDERTLYVATLAGNVVALAREDGKLRWTAALGERVYSAPLVHDDGTLYVGSDAKKLVALSPDGAVLWRLEVDGEADTGPVFAKDGTIVFSAGASVLSVRRGGDVAWRFTAKGKVFTAPAVTDSGLVIVGSQDDRVYAIDGTGAAAWATNLGADVDGAAVVGDDGAIYVGTDKGEVVRLDARGKVVWRTPVGGYVRGVLSLGRNGDVLVGTYGPVPHLVRLTPEGLIWGAFPIKGTGAKEFGIHGGPLEDADGALYFGAQDDSAYAIDPEGRLRWRFPTGADVDAPLTMLSDGSLIVASEDGTVTMLLP